MKKRWLGAFLFFCLSATAFAGVDEQPKTDVLFGMLVSGHVDVAADGTVTDYSLRKPERLPTSVRLLVGNMISAMEFEPLVVDGVAVQSKNRMSVRVVAREAADGDYELRIQSAHFSPGESGPEIKPIGPLRAPPFPRKAAGASGTVYLVLKVGQDGRVQDAVAEQVNLRSSSKADQMQRWRDEFATSATKAALKWRFVLPKDTASRKPFVSLRVPMDFDAAGRKPEWDASMYGKWIAYIPGPRVRAPWLDLTEDSSPDLSGGSIALVEEGRAARPATPNRSIVGEVKNVDCTESPEPKKSFFDGAGRVGAEMAGAILGAGIGERAGQAAVGGWYARSVGKARGASLGEKSVAAAGIANGSRQSSFEFICRILVRSEAGSEVEATYFGPNKPNIGATVRVHRQANGTYANTYDE